MIRPWGVLLATAGLALAAGCERPPITVTQTGYRGVGLEQNVNPRLRAALETQHRPPPVLPAAPPGPPGRYENVQVLSDLSPNEMARSMNAITAWVSPREGCVFCHNPVNMASDEKYQKVVSRRMLQMTRTINTQWQAHVGQTGVTCYTCHKGNPVPNAPWYYTDRNQALRHLLDREGVRVQSQVALAAVDSNRTSIKQTENTYSLMMHISRSLGVNCTYCHNSRQWYDWDESSPARLTALRGIRMVRGLNHDYLLPLQALWPEAPRLARSNLDGYGGLHPAYRATTARLGPMGDGPKLQCATCHNGANKPLFGAAMAADYAWLYGPETVAPPAEPVTATGGNSGPR